MHWNVGHNNPDSGETLAAHEVGSKSPIRPRILLVEPVPERATSRSLFLQASDYAVLQVASNRELQMLSGRDLISIVIIGEDFERARLQQLTQGARTKWPLPASSSWEGRNES